MAWDHSKTTTERGLGWQWQKLRLRILKRDDHLCQVCLQDGRPTPATEVDHVKPRAKGGTDDPDNLQAICTDCHRLKTDKEAAEAQGRKSSQKLRRDDGWKP